MLTYAEALDRLSSLNCTPHTQRISLVDAVGQYVAEAIYLAEDQPPFNRATMDGYAVRLKPDTTTYHVRGTIFAGAVFSGSLQPGEAVRIMTGVPAPENTTVIPIELTDRGETTVTITDVKALQPKKNIAWRGEDGHAGDELITAGTRMTPLVLSLAAMSGVSDVTIALPPRLACFTTGDEVGGSGPAGIRDSNGPFLRGFCAALGVPATISHVADDADSLKNTFSAALKNADILVTTGGVSAGAKDLVPAIAKELGFTTVFHHVAVQPGKPILLMQRQNKFFIGLPGNPVSVIATAHLFLWPLIIRFLGSRTPTWLSLPLTHATSNPTPRQQFMPAQFTAGGIQRTAWNGSGDLIAAAASDGLINLPVGCHYEAGHHVPFLPFIGWQNGMTGKMPPRGKTK
jgi:molybdopterin molybdotransferase